MTTDREQLASFRELLSEIYGEKIPDRLDSKELQIEKENDVKNIVSTISDLRYTRKKLLTQFDLYETQYEKKKAAFQTLSSKIPVVQQGIEKLRKKIKDRELLMNPAFEFFADMGLRMEISNISDEKSDCDVDLLLSQIHPDPARVFTVKLTYTASHVAVNSTDPSELLNKITDITELTNTRLVNGKFNFLFFLTEIRSAISEYLAE